MPERIQLHDLNAATPDDFVAASGDVFEHSPWVVRRTLPARPFATIADLHQAMTRTVEQASFEEQLALGVPREAALRPESVPTAR